MKKSKSKNKRHRIIKVLSYLFIIPKIRKFIYNSIVNYIDKKNIISEIKKCNKNTFFVIGDSHTDIFNKNNFAYKFLYTKGIYSNDYNKPDFITFHIGPATAFSSNSNNSSNNTKNKIDFLIKKSLLPKGCNIVCVFGEIDCRVHIKKQSELKHRSIDKIIEDTVINYGKTLLRLKNQGFNVFAYGPIGTQSDFINIDYNFPRYGTEEERNKITSKFNKQLELFCQKNDMRFITIFDKTIDNNYKTKSEFYIDGVHLNNKAYCFIDKAFKQNG